MKNLLLSVFPLVAASVCAGLVPRADVPPANNEFWNTTARIGEPVRVSESVSVEALSALDARSSGFGASLAISGLDSRLCTTALSNGGCIREAAPLLILIR